MRRATSVASFGIRLASLFALAGCVALAPAALAQRGGGHAVGFGGGHAGGFGGGFSGHSFGGGFSGHSAGGFSGHSFGGYSGSFGRSPSFGTRGSYGSFGSRGYSYGSRMTWPARSRSFATPARRGYGIADRTRSGYGRGRDWDRDGDRDRFRSRYLGYGYGYGYPYANSWEVLPWEIGYPDFYGYGDNSWVGQSDSYAGVQQDQGYQDQGYDAGPQEDYRPAYGDAPEGNWSGQAPVGAQAKAVADEPALTLIFNDGHQQSIRNYALTSSSLLVLDDTGSGRARRIPLSDVNVAATQRAAQSAGLDFSPPATTTPASF